MAVAAGTVVTAAVVVDLSPFLKWSLALIAGGGTAGVVQGGPACCEAFPPSPPGAPGISCRPGGTVGSALFTFLALALPLLALALLALAVLATAWLCAAARTPR
jgi:hypothetical protein